MFKITILISNPWILLRIIEYSLRLGWVENDILLNQVSLNLFFHVKFIVHELFVKDSTTTRFMFNKNSSAVQFINEVELEIEHIFYVIKNLNSVC